MFLTCSSLADLTIFGILALMVLHSLKLAIQGRWLAFDPLNTFWGGAFVCYVMQPAMFWKTFIAWHGQSLFETSLLWTLFALACVVVGYECGFGSALGRKLPGFSPQLAPNRLFACGLAVIAVGILGYLALMVGSGGVAEWLSTPRGGTDYGGGIPFLGYLGALTMALSVGVTLLLFHVNFHPVSGLKTALAWGLGVLLWLWYVYLGGRSPTITLAAMLLAAYYLPRRKNPTPALLALSVAVVALLVTFMGNYRDRFANLEFNSEQLRADEVAGETIAQTTGFGGKESDPTPGNGLEFNCVMATISLVPETVPYNFGYPLLDVVTRPIPHSLWPGKIYPAAESHTPILFFGNLGATQLRDSDLLAGPALTFVGWYYATGGGVALLLGGLFTGSLLRTIRTLYDRRPGSQTDMLLFASLIMVGFGDAVSGPFVWLVTYPFTLLVLLPVFKICGQRAPAAGRLDLAGGL